jgi:hypothetical protein
MSAAEERKRFFELADRLAQTSDPEEQSRLKEELARMTFGAAGSVAPRAGKPRGTATEHEEIYDES